MLSPRVILEKNEFCQASEVHIGNHIVSSVTHGSQPLGWRSSTWRNSADGSPWTTRRTAKVLAQHGWRSWQQHFGISNGIYNQNEDVQVTTYMYVYIYIYDCMCIYIYIHMGSYIYNIIYIILYIYNIIYILYYIYMIIYGHIPTYNRYWPIPISAYLWQNGNGLFSHQTKSGMFRGKLWIHAQKLGI